MLANPIMMHAFNDKSNRFPERHVTALEAIVDDPSTLLAWSHTNTAGPTTELEILSASRYPHGLVAGYDSDNSQRKRKEAPGVNPKQLYGGIVLRATSSSNDQEHDSSPAERERARERPKKKAKKSNSNDDAGNEDSSKKQRGRPRLDPQDETAADKRRTQIRLAQRAYRSRKETTIVGLKQKVVDLQSTIEKMNTTFLSLHDNLIDAGITSGHASLATQLQAAIDEFTALASITEAHSDDDESTKIAEMTGNEKGRRPSQCSSTPLQTPPRSGSIEATRQRTVSDDFDAEELPNTGPYAYMDTDSWMGTQQDLMQFNALVPEVTMSTEPIYTKSTSAPFWNGMNVDMSFLNSSIEKPLPSAGNNGMFYTYSFQETTFARRLQRMTLERGFRNLTDPRVDPEYIKRCFRFTFCFSNRKRMLQRFQDTLKRRAGESLENWSVPFFYIGGAGTHYPRKDRDGKPIYPPNMLAPEKAFGQEFGPRAWIEVETPRQGTTQDILDAIGFGGQWFDSHDVEEYLKTKGIYLDGQSSFIEIDPHVLQLTVPDFSQEITSASENSSNTSGQSPLRTPSPSGNGGLQEAQDLFMPGHIFESMNEQDNSAQYVYNKQIWPWPDAPVFPMEDFNPESPMLARRSQPLTFDVEKFLERMIDGASCLGRAPGYRKELVDNALAMSLAEAF